MNIRTPRFRSKSVSTVLTAVLLALFTFAAHAGIRTVGAVSAVQVQDTPAAPGSQKAVFQLADGGTLEVVPYAPDVVRVRYHFGGLWEKEEVAIAKPIEQWASFNCDFNDQGDIFLVETDDLVVEIVKNPNVQVHFKDKAGWYLLRDDRMEYNADYHPNQDSSYWDLQFTRALPKGFKLKAIKEMPAHEAYFGFGEYAGPLNRRGRNIQCWNTDTFAWGEGQNPMYMSLPFFYGAQGPVGDRPAFAYGVFFNNPGRPVFRMGTEWGNRYSFEAGDGQMDYFFFGGGDWHTMKNVLARYTELTGEPCALPKWALGYHQSRHSYDTQQKVENLAWALRNQDVPCDAVYLDIGVQRSWTQQHQLTFNANFYNVPGMIDYCESLGVKLVPIIEPCLTLEDPMYAEAAAGLHFLKDRWLNNYVGNNFLGAISWIDFSSTPAREWWKGKLGGYLNQYRFEAIWNDLNEPNEANTPLDVVYYVDGRYGGGGAAGDSRKWHANNRNTFCVRECSASYEALRQRHPDKRPFVLSRAGWPGIQRYATGWSGDNVASYDHLRHNIPLGVSVMISGQANFGHDVGGFVGNSWGELLTRWTEWGSMNPVFRNHTINGTGPQEPWAYGEPYTGLIRDTIKFRYELMPYLYTLSHESTVSGIPMNTPTVFHFMDDTETHYQNDYDFMVGDSLLAAPVYQPGANERWTYLPEGTAWYYWYNDERMDGGNWVRTDAPLGTLPLFVRDGAILPMGPWMYHANEYQPEYIDYHVWPKAYSEFTLYEDDGETLDYLAGEYATTRLISQERENGWTFSILPREGSYDPGREVAVVYAHDLDLVTAVHLNGENLSKYGDEPSLHANARGWMYDPARRLLIVKVPDSAELSSIDASITYVPTVRWIGNTHSWPSAGNWIAGDDLWVNIESAPVGAAVSARVVYSLDGGATWLSRDLEFGGLNNGNDWWHLNLGAFPAGTTVRYAIEVVDAAGSSRWDSNGGGNYLITAKTGQSLQWLGNTYHWPLNGNIHPQDNLWVNLETYPIGAARSAHVVFSDDEGVSWYSVPMAVGGRHGNNDWWHLNLETFASGTHIQYAVVARDGKGVDHWDSNRGMNFHALVE